MRPPGFDKEIWDEVSKWPLSQTAPFVIFGLVLGLSIIGICYAFASGSISFASHFLNWNAHSTAIILISGAAVVHATLFLFRLNKSTRNKDQKIFAFRNLFYAILATFLVLSVGREDLGLPRVVPYAFAWIIVAAIFIIQILAILKNKEKQLPFRLVVFVALIWIVFASVQRYLQNEDLIHFF